LEKNNEWRKANPEKTKATKRNSRNKHIDTEKRYKAEKAEQITAYWREARQMRPHVFVAIKLRRRARLMALPCDFTADDEQRMMKYWNNSCAVCGRKVGAGFDIAGDHWIALADTRLDNPGTVVTNIVPLCHARKGSTGGCNNTKWRKDPRQWLYERYAKEQAGEILDRIEMYFTWAESAKNLSNQNRDNHQRT
jgi:hypothetical protein